MLLTKFKSRFITLFDEVDEVDEVDSDYADTDSETEEYRNLYNHKVESSIIDYIISTYVNNINISYSSKTGDIIFINCYRKGKLHRINKPAYLDNYFEGKFDVQEYSIYNILQYRKISDNEI